MLRPFVRREDLWPAVWTIIEWFVTEGDVEQVAKGRLKFLVEARGESAFRAAFTKRFATLRAEPSLRAAADRAAGGRRAGARARAGADARLARHHPPRTARRVRVDHGAGAARRPVGRRPGGAGGGGADGAGRAHPRAERAGAVGTRSATCHGRRRARRSRDSAPTGRGARPTCAPARASRSARWRSPGASPSPSPSSGRCNGRPDLPRDLSIAVSGCPNSCTKQQVADLGLVGHQGEGRRPGRARVPAVARGRRAAGLGEPVLRLLEEEVPAAVLAATEVWVALRRPGEAAGATYRRAGLDVVGRAIEMRLRGWTRRATDRVEAELAVCVVTQTVVGVCSAFPSGGRSCTSKRRSPSGRPSGRRSRRAPAPPRPGGARRARRRRARHRLPLRVGLVEPEERWTGVPRQCARARRRDRQPRDHARARRTSTRRAWTSRTRRAGFLAWASRRCAPRCRRGRAAAIRAAADALGLQGREVGRARRAS